MPYLGGARAVPARSASWPTTTSSWCMLWSSLATGDARLAAAALGRMRPIPPTTSWVTYVRGHDDIGWAVTDTDAAAVGARAASPTAGSSTTSSPAASPARSPAGRCSRRTRPPATRASPAPRRRCAASRTPWNGGTTTRWRPGHPAPGAAVLGGLRLRRHPAALHGRRARAAQRHRVPRPTPRGRRTTGGCTGRRWTGRRPSAGHDPAALEGRVFGWLQRLGEVRRALPALRGGGECAVLDVGNAARARLAAPAPAQRHLRRAGQLQPRRPDRRRRHGDRVRHLRAGADQRRAAPSCAPTSCCCPGSGFAWYAEP